MAVEHVCTRIGTAGRNFGETAHHNLEQFAKVSESAAASLNHAQITGARRLGEAGTPGGHGGDGFVEGIGPDSAVVRFRPEQVHSIPIKDGNGDIFGVSFPTKAQDEGQITSWSQQPTRTSDVAYVPVPTDKLPNPNEPAPTIAPDWSFRPEPAPWGADVQRIGHAPVYVDAHGNPTSFAVAADLGAPGGRTVVRVDGANFGRVLEGNPHFRRALAENPGMPVVSMSCKTAPEGSTAAESTAQYLQNEAGVDRDFHAWTGLVNPVTGENGMSWLVVEQKDGSAPYRSFPYPRDPAGE